MNYYEGINEYGFPQAYDEEWYSICCDCQVIGYVNRGDGMACPQCREKYLRECQLDYDEENSNRQDQRGNVK